MRIQYFDRGSAEMQYIDLPENVDCVGITVNKTGYHVEVNTDAVQIFYCGDRLSMHEYDDLVASYEQCPYCGGDCLNEPYDSEHLCDGYAGDIDGLARSK